MTTDLERVSDLRFDGDKIVYIRRLSAGEASELVPADDLHELGSADELFSVHNSDGDRLAIVEGRDAAFAAARAYDLRPRSVH
ncbi:MAG: DUF1150 family protein [Pseudomonadota bacterium]